MVRNTQINRTVEINGKMNINKEQENMEGKGTKKLTYADVVRQAQINEMKNKQQKSTMMKKQ
jgi:hypothetical protein